MNSISIGFTVASIVVGLLFIILIKRLKEFLKDESSAMPKPYSLARSILFYWTVIIIFSIFCIGIKKGELPELNEKVLILMGIIIGTSGTARIIDYVQISENVARHQDEESSRNFLVDILSDNNGISVHRFQTVLFNLIYGSYFLAVVLGNYKMPEFDPKILALLGMSSGTYALLKIPENKGSAVPIAAKKDDEHVADEFLQMPTVTVKG